MKKLMALATILASIAIVTCGKADPEEIGNCRTIGPAAVGRPIAALAIVGFEVESLRLKPRVLCSGKTYRTPLTARVPAGEGQPIRGKLVQKCRQLQQTLLSRRFMHLYIVSCPLFHAAP